MRAKSMVLILIALGCGLVASIGISQVVNTGKQEPVSDTVKVLVAMNDMDINDEFSATSVKLEDWPKDKVPPGALTDLEQIQGQYARSRLFAGEPVLEAKVMNEPGYVAPIPEGYRVVPVKVNTNNIVGVVQAGDRVDILVYLRKGGRIEKATTRTVLQDVRIYAVNNETERLVDRDGKSMKVNTVSVLLQPDQVAKLMLASEMGAIQLALRAPTDTTDAMYKEITEDDILQGTPDSADEPRERNPQGDDLVDFLNGASNAAGPGEAAGQGFTMTVHTVDGVQVYQWLDESQLPQQVAASAGGAPLAGVPGAMPALPALDDLGPDDNGAAEEDAGEETGPELPASGLPTPELPPEFKEMLEN